MAYKTDELEKQALEAIEKHKLFFIEDIVSYLPCDKTTFYAHKLHESNSIKDALLEVKTNLKVSMRSKWFRSENATLQLALMKLLSNDEELRKLSMQHQVNEEAEKPIFNGIDLDIKDEK
jgi:hypothetical protein